jgi:hypothetical protein
MNADERTPGLAVVLDRSSDDASEMKAYLDAHGLGHARWFDPIAVSSLDKAVRDGRIRRVVFPDVASLFEAIWDEEIVFDAWLRTDVRLDFVVQPEGTTESIVGIVYGHWQTWKRRRRRRQAAAGILISAMVLGLCFLINAVVP